MLKLKSIIAQYRMYHESHRFSRKPQPALRAPYPRGRDKLRDAAGPPINWNLQHY